MTTAGKLRCSQTTANWGITDYATICRNPNSLPFQNCLVKGHACINPSALHIISNFWQMCWNKHAGVGCSAAHRRLRAWRRQRRRFGGRLTRCGADSARAVARTGSPAPCAQPPRDCGGLPSGGPGVLVPPAPCPASPAAEDSACAHNHHPTLHCKYPKPPKP